MQLITFKAKEKLYSSQLEEKHMQEIGEIGGQIIKVHIMPDYYVLLWQNNTMLELKLISRVDR